MMSAHKKWVAAAAGAILLLGIVVFMTTRDTAKAPADVVPQENAFTLTPPIVSVSYSCTGGRRVVAQIEERTGGKAGVTLDTGRTYSLTQTISASGVRYANADESFVFWTKGNTAFVEESGTTTIRDCVAQTQ